VAREVVYHALIQKAVLRKRVLDRLSLCLLLSFDFVAEEELLVVVESSGLISAEDVSISRWLVVRRVLLLCIFIFLTLIFLLLDLFLLTTPCSSSI